MFRSQRTFRAIAYLLCGILAFILPIVTIPVFDLSLRASSPWRLLGVPIIAGFFAMAYGAGQLVKVIIEPRDSVDPGSRDGGIQSKAARRKFPAPRGMPEDPELVSPLALAHFAHEPACGPQFDHAGTDRYGRELEDIARVEGTQRAIEVVLSQLAQFATPALSAADEQSRRCSFDWFAFAAEATAVRADLSATDDGSIFAASLRLSHNSANRSAIQRQYERIDEERPDPPMRNLGRPGEWRSSSIHSTMRAMGLGPLIAYPRSQTHPNHRAGRARAVQVRMLVEFLVVLRFIEAVEMRANRYGLPFAIQLDAGSEYYSGPEALYSAQPMMARFVDCRVTTGDPRAREAFRQYREDELTRYDAETEKFALAMVDTYERYGYLPWQWLPEEMDELRKRLAGVQWTLPPSKSPDQPSPEEVGKLIEMFRAQRATERPASKPPIV